MSSLPVIQKMLVEEFGLTPEQVQPDSQLDELGVDSLATVEFMFMLEDRFKLKMSGEPVPIKTVGDIAKEVDAAMEKQGISLTDN
ncbi:phosphopantetheine-binding protein [Ferrovum sp. PN-J185]|uniref:acyl carrier protein n=1 Tax=Ferrovum sp. PN-J185 TaxID=1356306 RepID=UPI0007971E5C|nr:phosphopantetheine-binding protein [Ferrovum sp. PN-J185]KXW55624.1 acyl carrier protein [Ferrovum sp. PN-J185]MCC6068873.1 phosphopantetheine-binding protein [Ferrovum sp. PN-J185]MDE1891165.1 acyl carrier protein [Betaproteobacteria bacterium]MDE2056205.1 acyl carrier protein [Betaproteobacteria bacterium]